MLTISRSPLRVSLFGGGSDFESYYSNHGGRVLSFAINKYVYTAINSKFREGIRFSYSKTENVLKANQIEHQICRLVLEEYGIETGIEIVTIADVSSKGTGLGSSSAFTASLVANLNYRDEKILNKQELAEIVCNIEINLHNSPIGKQDQYASVLGGINILNFDRLGQVSYEKISVSDTSREILESSLLLVHTEMDRSTDDVLKLQHTSATNDIQEYNSKIDKMVNMINEAKEFVVNAQIEKLGRLLNESWQIKKSLSTKTTNQRIDEIYDKGIESGSFGGKLLGAGSGGFILFVCPPGKRDDIAKNIGMDFLTPKIDFEGTKILEYGNVQK